jgi:hypothetical protein
MKPQPVATRINPKDGLPRVGVLLAADSEPNLPDPPITAAYEAATALARARPLAGDKRRRARVLHVDACDCSS